MTSSQEMDQALFLQLQSPHRAEENNTHSDTYNTGEVHLYICTVTTRREIHLRYSNDV